jgi:hypothetical protein
MRVSWENPVATADTPFIGIRLVRNFDQFPEHAEDGDILIETRGTNPKLLPTNKYFDDTGVIAGQFVYYRIWLLMSTAFADAPLEWLAAGQTYGLVPNPHDTTTPVNTFKTAVVNGSVVDQRIAKTTLMKTHDKFMSLLPDIYHNDDLSNFLTPFSFMLDEIMTYADITKPDLSGRKTNPTVLNLQSFQLALPFESNGVTSAQKNLVKDAIWTYSRKGTKAGLERFVENITGYNSDITVLPNLLLSMQDSSFYQGVGNWNSSAGATLTAEQSGTVPTPGTSDRTFDSGWVGKVVTSTTNTSISLGADLPITEGIPVSENTAYTLMFWVKSAASSNITPSVVWYDVIGNKLSSSSGGLTATSTSFGTAKTLQVTSPASAVRASVKVVLASADTYSFDRFQFSADDVSGDSPVSVAYYSEPRTIDIFLEPSKLNYLPNPSFEVNTTGWSATSGTTISSVTASSSEILAPTEVPSGTKLLKASVTTSGAVTTSPISIGVGTYATFSIYHAVKTTTQPFTLNLFATCNQTILNSAVTNNVATVWLDDVTPFQVGDSITTSTSGPLNSINSTITAVGPNYIKFNATHANYAQQVDTGTIQLVLSVSKNLTSKTTWQRDSVTLYIPSSLPTETYVFCQLIVNQTAVLYFESAQLEPNIHATDYFDGSLVYQGAAWEGTAHNSVSALYFNRTHHLARLTTTVMNYLPKNSTYIVRDYLTSPAVVKLA